ncbi:MAG: hypothetical protein QGG36_30985 [Pirellulaceae bacterium]|jgi:hypothetical protein|nr:hypothetical protein [Pirellulaceae bacterium]MDP7020263.1 hypothetical protein [Pirellulaceae bacterium]
MRVFISAIAVGCLVCSAGCDEMMPHVANQGPPTESTTADNTMASADDMMAAPAYEDDGAFDPSADPTGAIPNDGGGAPGYSPSYGSGSQAATAADIDALVNGSVENPANSANLALDPAGGGLEPNGQGVGFGEGVEPTGQQFGDENATGGVDPIGATPGVDPIGQQFGDQGATGGVDPIGLTPGLDAIGQAAAGGRNPVSASAGAFGGNAGGANPIGQANPAGATPSNGQTGDREIWMSSCVGLPQTLPTGTCMTFSVEYRFTTTAPKRNAIYYWVIQPSKGGKQVVQKVSLKQRGKLQGVTPSLRVEHGPFYCHIVEEAQRGQRKRISKSYQLPTIGQ